MKRSILMLSLMALGTTVFASESNSQPADGTQCTMTETVTSSSNVECPDGTTITISATSSKTVTADDCETASIAAQVLASIAANGTVTANVKAVNYICP